MCPSGLVCERMLKRYEISHLDKPRAKDNSIMRRKVAVTADLLSKGHLRAQTKWALRFFSPFPSIKAQERGEPNLSNLQNVNPIFSLDLIYGPQSRACRGLRDGRGAEERTLHPSLQSAHQHHIITSLGVEVHWSWDRDPLLIFSLQLISLNHSTATLNCIVK